MAFPFLALLATGFGAVNQYQQGRDAQRIGEYNARLAETEAKIERDKAAREEEAHRRDLRQLQGRQRASIAQSGTGYGGSTGLLLEQSDAAAELDALNIRYAGQLRSMGLLSEAAMSRARGSNARRQGNLLAGAELLSGASDSYSSHRLQG